MRQQVFDHIFQAFYELTSGKEKSRARGRGQSTGRKCPAHPKDRVLDNLETGTEWLTRYVQRKFCENEGFEQCQTAFL